MKSPIVVYLFCMAASLSAADTSSSTVPKELGVDTYVEIDTKQGVNVPQNGQPFAVSQALCGDLVAQAFSQKLDQATKTLVPGYVELLQIVDGKAESIQKIDLDVNVMPLQVVLTDEKLGFVAGERRDFNQQRYIVQRLTGECVEIKFSDTSWASNAWIDSGVQWLAVMKDNAMYVYDLSEPLKGQEPQLLFQPTQDEIENGVNITSVRFNAAADSSVSVSVVFSGWKYDKVLLWKNEEPARVIMTTEELPANVSDTMMYRIVDTCFSPDGNLLIVANNCIFRYVPSSGELSSLQNFAMNQQPYATNTCLFAQIDPTGNYLAIGVGANSQITNYAAPLLLYHIPTQKLCGWGLDNGTTGPIAPNNLSWDTSAENNLRFVTWGKVVSLGAETVPNGEVNSRSPEINGAACKFLYRGNQVALPDSGYPSVGLALHGNKVARAFHRSVGGLIQLFKISPAFLAELEKEIEVESACQVFLPEGKLAFLANRSDARGAKQFYVGLPSGGQTQELPGDNAWIDKSARWMAILQGSKLNCYSLQNPLQGQEPKLIAEQCKPIGVTFFGGTEEGELPQIAVSDWNSVKLWQNGSLRQIQTAKQLGDVPRVINYCFLGAPFAPNGDLYTVANNYVWRSLADKAAQKDNESQLAGQPALLKPYSLYVNVYSSPYSWPPSLSNATFFDLNKAGTVMAMWNDTNGLMFYDVEAQQNIGWKEPGEGTMMPAYPSLFRFDSDSEGEYRFVINTRSTAANGFIEYSDSVVEFVRPVRNPLADIKNAQDVCVPKPPEVPATGNCLLQ